ncbi:MAG TPA: transposase [Stellaceae bacterium]|nr:transposase [Stellaceae bacterium]
MTISELTLKSSDTEPVRRFEIFTGTGRRRDWSVEDKARIVAESYAPETTVSEVARRYALSPQQLFAWRRAARRSAMAASVSGPSFVPAVVVAPEPSARLARRSKRKPVRDAGIVELEIDGVTVRVGRGAETKTIGAVIRALKAGA